MKILFMGTPECAVTALEALEAAGHEIVAVVTQPDKAKGRKKELAAPPVKIYANEHQIPVLQPNRIKKAEEIQKLKQYPADVYVTFAFGQILSKEILEIPPLGCVNIHASLLPKYRGSSPIQWCLINGEEKTGVTIMKMDEGIDTGDILYVKEYQIADDETQDSLFEKLGQIGADAIVEALPLFEEGRLMAIPQKEEEATYTQILKKEVGKIDWSISAWQIACLVRGVTSWPGAYTTYQGKQLKVWKCKVKNEVENGEDSRVISPGTIAEVTKELIIIACGSGYLQIEELQLEGKKRMNAHDFLLGSKFEVGQTLE